MSYKLVENKEYFNDKVSVITRYKEETNGDQALHYTTGPAKIYYYEHGSVSMELYYDDGLLHRVDGPAWLEYDEFGKIQQARFYLNNVPIPVTNMGDFKKYIRYRILE